ncbi:hypothetical protein Ccrd_014967 [Cynara cardunculus var. scolymus]|uniref:Leucine-rich repeat-containing protein n=1 Tax=Cynara cardunculus var. scolymus TaxID=59895 RepID=A0A103YCP8_CYNCS|nr:hypothetical protein Ccrd_014967 [Cynara cardunculus var. scolymus]
MLCFYLNKIFSLIITRMMKKIIGITMSSLDWFRLLSNYDELEHEYLIVVIGMVSLVTNFTNDVIALNLSCGMLRGTIDPNSTLFNLSHLQTLNLAFNNLTNSQLPREIRRLSNSLTHLNISYTGFIGRVPTDITILRKLVSLDLSRNHLKLEPHVFYYLLYNSTSLEELFLNKVNISSILPTYLNPSSMKSLHLSSTGLLRKLPNNIFHLPYLEELDLSYNYDLIGRFPKAYTNTSIPLKLLDLSYNNLSR